MCAQSKTPKHNGIPTAERTPIFTSCDDKDWSSPQIVLSHLLIVFGVMQMTTLLSSITTLLLAQLVLLTTPSAGRSDDDSRGGNVDDNRIINIVPGNQSVSTRAPVVYQVSIWANADDEHANELINGDTDDAGPEDGTRTPTLMIIEVSPPVFCTHSSRYQMWWDDDGDLENNTPSAGNHGVADIAFNGNDALLVNDLKGQMQNHTVMSFVVGNTSFTTPQLQTLGTIHMPDDLRLDRHHSFITMIAKVVEPHGKVVVGETQESVHLITGFHDISPVSVEDNTWFDSFEVALCTYITYPEFDGKSVIRIRQSTTSDNGRPIGYVRFDRLVDKSKAHVPFWNWHWHDYYPIRNHVEQWSRREAIFLTFGLTAALVFIFYLICNDSPRNAGYRRI